MSSTQQQQAPHDGSESSTALSRAWISVALIPVFLVVSVLLTLVLYEVFGYKPENADAPLWVDLVTSLAAVVVFLVPCVTAVHYGRQASRDGQPRGLLPMWIGALAGLSLTALTVVSTLGPF